METRPGTFISTFIFASWVILISGTEQHLESKELPFNFDEADLDTWTEKVISGFLCCCCFFLLFILFFFKHTVLFTVDDFYKKAQNLQRSMLKTINKILFLNMNAFANLFII